VDDETLFLQLQLAQHMGNRLAEEQAVAQQSLWFRMLIWIGASSLKEPIGTNQQPGAAWVVTKASGED
jgi:hypothetical protein